jgi:hypothetical protein
MLSENIGARYQTGRKFLNWPSDNSVLARAEIVSAFGELGDFGEFQPTLFEVEKVSAKLWVDLRLSQTLVVFCMMQAMSHLFLVGEHAGTPLLG